MKLDVKFSESNQSFDPQLGESNQTFAIEVGEVIDLSEGERKLAYENGRKDMCEEVLGGEW